MNCGKTVHLRRFFRRPRTVIIPMDHPMYGGPVAGLEDPKEIVRLIAGTEADGIIISPWVLPRVVDVVGQLALVARLDGGNTALGSRVDQTDTVTSVEQAVRMGFEMAALNIFIGGDNELEMVRKLAAAAEACERWGLPLMGEMIPASDVARHYGRSAAASQAADQGDPVTIVSRIGAEFGADIIKTVYSGNKSDLARTVQTATVPIVIAGGPKAGTDAEFLRIVRECVEAGAAGVCMGRNVWQRPRPEGMVAALCAIVHDNAGVDEALRLL